MEYVQVACPHCGKAMRVPSSANGRTVACPHCNQRFTAPREAAPAAASAAPPSPPAPPVQAAPPTAAPGYQLVACPGCGGQMQVSSSQVGQAVACPHCAQRFTCNSGGGVLFPSSSAGGQTSLQYVTGGMATALRQTRPWVLFLAILGFIGAGLMILIGLFMVAGGAMLGRHSGVGGVPAVFGLLYVALSILYLIPAILLFRYGTSIRGFLVTGRSGDMETALVAQKSFWRFTGIMALVVLCLYAVFLVVLMVTAAAAF